MSEQAETKKAGDRLKVRWKASVSGGLITWSPADLFVELNGQPVDGCKSLSIFFDQNSRLPEATLYFTLDDLDLDVDTLTALRAYAEQRKK